MHDLFEGLQVHEVGAHIVLIKKLVGPSFHPGSVNFDSCGKGVLDHLAGGEAFQFGSVQKRGLCPVLHVETVQW